ncbi:MAG: hypothetical protein U9R58_04240 [Chloroflexota bacterium]|nr:hypothetical protein [Chloroflexota bacterium]
MCGGHGAYRIIGRLIDQTLDEQSHLLDPDVRRKDTRRDIEQEVKIMYASGEIDSGSYHRLIEMARKRQLNWDDLEQIQRRTQTINLVSQTPARKRDAEIVSDLNQLYSHRKRLEAARQETQGVLDTLEKDASRLNEQAKTAEEKAQKAIANEDVSRSYLQTRQEALERVATLKNRINDLRENLHRIESLEAELATREAELNALESGVQLADLEAQIREDLLDDN